jgi:radical SAM superfamily enzyme YgiQ (UPF0313 family)
LNIQLIQPKLNWPHPYCETPSRALLILGTMAKQAGHNINLVHHDIESVHIPEDVDLVGITCNTFQVGDAVGLAQLAGAKKGRKVVIGGPHAQVWSGICTGVDVVVGPGERYWADLVGADYDGGFVTPDYSLVNMQQFHGVKPIGNPPGAAIMASKGCPGECTYCNTPILWGKKITYRDPDDVIEEVLRLHTDYKVNEVFFQDDTFNINHAWAIEIFERIIKAGLPDKMLFRIACRCDEKLVTKEFLDMAFKAGVWAIFYGVESGTQEMLDRMKKHITLDEIRRAFRMTKEAHIQRQASYIVGMPGETHRTAMQILKFNAELAPEMSGVCPACPFPGTELDKEVTAKGHKKDVPYSDYTYGDVLCRTDELGFDYLEAFCRTYL